jgi:hypothetical protein
MGNWTLEGTSVVWDEDAPDPVDESAPFDPSGHSIADVKTYVEAHPDETQAIYDAESEGKARSSLLDWLTAG